MLKKTLKNAPSRLVRALGFSGRGLKSAFIKEEAFRLEVLGLVLMGAALAASAWPMWKKAALVAAYMLIPLAELFNSALEGICDLISTDHHPLIGQAKDKGSAAVLLAIVVNILVLAALWLAD